MYPVRTHSTIVKPWRNSYILKDDETLSTFMINADLKYLLYLLTGTNSISSIVNEIQKKYTESTGIEESLMESLEYLRETGILKIVSSPRTSSEMKITEKNLKYPLNLVYLEVTRQCNLRCRHCYAEAGEKRPHELTTKEFLSVIDQLSEMGVFYAEVTGGEPLLREDIYEILSALKEKKIGVFLFTNGILLDSKTIQKLKEIEVDQVVVSLDGASASSHNYLRGDHVFSRVVENIKELKKCGLKLRINTVIHQKNKHELVPLLNLLKEIGADEFRMSPLIPQGRGKENQELGISPEEYRKILLEYSAFAKSNGKTQIPIQTGEGYCMEAMGMLKKTSCGVGTFSCMVRADGYVVICPSLSDDRWSAGNIREHSLGDIWEHSSVFHPLRMFSVNRIEACKTCQWKYTCLGGCRAHAYIDSSSFYAKDETTCMFYKMLEPPLTEDGFYDSDR
ncbi:MAG: radical SAM protein [Theionarchaea archaeon]|nr:radical SAM protein [Theionarchaea archaeon]